MDTEYASQLSRKSVLPVEILYKHYASRDPQRGLYQSPHGWHVSKRKQNQRYERRNSVEAKGAFGTMLRRLIRGRPSRDLFTFHTHGKVRQMYSPTDWAMPSLWSVTDGFMVRRSLLTASDRPFVSLEDVYLLSNRASMVSGQRTGHSSSTAPAKTLTFVILLLSTKS